ncbi:hypothetical protein HX849_00315, partial [Marine Group I thaumarchaeote]|nr:hypothetical protein [Marine Group I thaumarchaeote]
MMNFMKHIIASLLILFVLGLMVPNVFADNDEVIIVFSSLDEKYDLCSDTNELSAEIRKQTKLEIKEEWRQLCYDFYDNSYAGYEAIT